KAGPRRDERPGGWLFDIVRREYAALAFVIAPGSDGASWDRARTKPRCGEGARAHGELPSCKPGLRPFPVSVLLSPVKDGTPRPTQTASVALVSPCRRVTYREGHRRQVVPRLLFFSVFYRETEPSNGSRRRARSLIAVSRLAMLRHARR